MKQREVVKMTAVYLTITLKTLNTCVKADQTLIDELTNKCFNRFGSCTKFYTLLVCGICLQR